MPEAYLSKSIEAPSGVDAVVWDGSMFTCDLQSGKGVVVLDGYVDEGAFLGDSIPVHALQSVIPDVTQLTTYEAFFGEALTMLVGDPESIFYGGTVEPCPIDQHGRNLIKSITVETGAQATCWRCVSLRANLVAGYADFVMRGWKDVDAFCNGKNRASKSDRPWTIRKQIEDFTTYPALYTEIVTLLLSDEDDAMYGAVLTEVV